MTTVNGYESIFGMKVESTAGTAIEVGAGDGLDVRDGANFGARNVVKFAEDVLQRRLKKSWLNPESKKASLPLYLQYWGLELTWGMIQGAAVAAAAHPDGHPLAWVLEFKQDTQAEAATLVAGLGEGALTADIQRIAELSGFRPIQVEIDQPAGEEPAVSVEGAGKNLTYGSTTNTTSTVPNVTAPDASYPARPATFADLTMRLAHQDSASFDSDEDIDGAGHNLKIKSGVSDDIKKNLATTGGLVPVADGRSGADLMVRFLRDDSDCQAFRDLIDENEKLKGKLEYASDEGIPGCSISDATPSEDISGSANSKIKITFTLTKEDGSTDTEDHEVTLTVGALNTGTLIAAAIQAAFRAETATDSRFQRLLDAFICTWNDTVSSKYFLGIDSDDHAKIQVVAASSVDLSPELKLGIANSGVEPNFVAHGFVAFMPEVVFSPVGEDVKGGVNPVEFTGKCMAAYSSAPVGFTTTEDDRLGSNLSDEEIRLMVIGRVTAAPF